MSREKRKNSFQQHIFEEIQKQIGKNNVLTIPDSILHYATDLPAAVFLSQLIYWCDKGKSPDGYIFKTYKEWRSETLLSEYQIRKASKKFQGMGILHSKKKKANGAPTIYYKLDRTAFINAFLKFLRMESENIKNGNVRNSDSLTEPTSDLSSEPTLKKDKGGAKSIDVRSTPLSFLSYKKKYEIDPDVSLAIDHFLEQYKSFMLKEHPRLKPDQWSFVVDTMSQGIYDTDMNIFVREGLEYEYLIAMIDAYFKKDYQRGCDYRLLHFTSAGVFTNLYYEEIHYSV